jgi:hypothetical protein
MHGQLSGDEVDGQLPVDEIHGQLPVDEVHVLLLCHEVRQVHAELLSDVQLPVYEKLRLYEEL